MISEAKEARYMSVEKDSVRASITLNSISCKSLPFFDDQFKTNILDKIRAFSTLCL